MAGLSDYMAKKVLEHLVGKTAMGSLPTCYVALFTTAPADDGTGGTEVSGGSYARVATAGSDWNAASGTGPSSISNANDIVFPTSTASWGTVVAVGLYDASSGGNLLAWDYLGSGAWEPFTCSNASPGVVTCPGHSLANSDLVEITAEFGGTLPTTGGSWAGAKTVASVSGDTFTVGVNTTSTGNGLLRKLSSQAVPNSAIFKLLAGQATIVLA